MSLTWPYESGNDELDTKYGNLAYEYNTKFPDNSSIHIELELKASQKAQE